ncbi:MAG: hypothetical protein WC924_04895 [Candidatus Gracilibacteria bacterium]
MNILSTELAQKYQDKLLASTQYKSGKAREIGIKEFVDPASLAFLVEELETGEVLLTLDGLEFIKEYYSFENFFKVLHGESYKVSASDLKWLFQTTKKVRGLNHSEVKIFELSQEEKTSAIDKYGETILGLNFRKSLSYNSDYSPPEYRACHLVDIRIFCFFLDSLDSAEVSLTKDGLDFIGDIYSFEKVVEIVKYLVSRNFLFRYKQSEDITKWLKHLGKFQEDRLKMLTQIQIKD